MTVTNSPRRTARSVKLPGIPEEQAEVLPGSVSVVASRPRSPPAFSTEYHRSFRTQGRPRPRNPVGGWQARNLSNILPSGSERPPQPSRASRRPPPETLLARQAQSQIFPADLRRPIQNASATGSDVNNNPMAPPPIVIGGRRRTGRWPWQARAQTSSIFLSETENIPRQVRTHGRHPWQERAQKSVIFEVLTGQDTGPKKKFRRTYEWDQRQSKLVTEAVQQKQDDNECQEKERKSRKDSSMPWKDRAMRSAVFSSPEKPACPRPVNYAWDQRRSHFSVHEDPFAQFASGSCYKDNYVKWQAVEDGKGIVKAAGKPCYTFDDVSDDAGEENRVDQTPTISLGGGKRRFKNAPGTSIGDGIVPLHAPPSKSSSSTNLPPKTASSQTCLEIVPVGYDFSNRGIIGNLSRR